MKQLIFILGLFASIILFGCSNTVRRYCAEDYNPQEQENYLISIKANKEYQTVLYLQKSNDEIISISNGNRELFDGEFKQFEESIYFSKVLVADNTYPISIKFKKDNVRDIYISKKKLRKYKFIVILKDNKTQKYNLNFSNKPMTIKSTTHNSG